MEIRGNPSMIYLTVDIYLPLGRLGSGRGTRERLDDPAGGQAGGLVERVDDDQRRDEGQLVPLLHLEAHLLEAGVVHRRQLMPCPLVADHPNNQTGGDCDVNRRCHMGAIPCLEVGDESGVTERDLCLLRIEIVGRAPPDVGCGHGLRSSGCGVLDDGLLRDFGWCGCADLGGWDFVLGGLSLSSVLDCQGGNHDGERDQAQCHGESGDPCPDGVGPCGRCGRRPWCHGHRERIDCVQRRQCQRRRSDVAVSLDVIDIQRADIFQVRPCRHDDSQVASDIPQENFWDTRPTDDVFELIVQHVTPPSVFFAQVAHMNERPTTNELFPYP